MMLDILNTVEPFLHVEHIEYAGHDHSGHSHGGEEGQGVWKEAWSLITDPAHAIAEVFYNLLDNLIIDRKSVV